MMRPSRVCLPRPDLAGRSWTAVLLLALVVPLPACRREPSGPAAPAEAIRLVDRALRARSAEEDFHELCDRFARRVSGSSGCDAAGSWLIRRLRDAGLESVTAEPFRLAEPWIPDRESAECVEPVAFPVRVAAVPGSPATTAPRVPLRVAPLGGTDADPATAVALLPTPPLDSASRVDADALREAADRAASAGFRALLVQSALPGRTLYRRPISRSGVLPLPVVVAAREDFARLARLDARSPARVTLDVAPSPEEPAKGLNVVAEIRGTELPDEIVLVGAHYDAWDLGAGAQDNAVNAALVVDVARGFRELGLRPRRTLRFVLFSGEEQERQGSAAYVLAHEAELDRHALALFFDLGGGAIDGFYFSERRELADVFAEALAPFRDFRQWKPLNLVYVGTDNLDFVLEGIPTAVASADLAPYARVHHTDLDLPGGVDLPTFRRNVAFASAVTWQMADRAERPSRRLSPAETRKLATRFGILRDVEGTWRADRLRRR